MTDDYRGKDGLYITNPGFGRIYHIFDKENRSLCGRAMMLFIDSKRCTPVEGTETYRKGDDCKACFRKAGLKVEAEDLSTLGAVYGGKS